MSSTGGLVLNRRAVAEQSVIDAVTLWKHGHKFGPSFRDIALLTNLPLGSVHEICRVLRAEGRLDFDDNIARSLREV